MNETVKHLLFALIRHDVCGEPLGEDVRSRLTEETVGALYRFAKAHDMAHIVAHVLDREGLLGLDEVSQKLRKQYLLAIYRHQQFLYALKDIEQALDAAGIPFMPLKGSVLRAYYPEGWMRTSCDVDVLVHPEDLARAKNALVETCGYKQTTATMHDVTLCAPNNVHVELHHTLIEDGTVAKVDDLLGRVWDFASPSPDCPHRMILSDDMFYFYHVAHIAKHVICGGCGIRPLLDDRILQHCVPHDPEKRRKLLDEGGLSAFEDAKKRLRDVWFADAEHDALSERLEKLILSGGVYGNAKTNIIVKKKRRGGSTRYLLSRIFLSADQLRLIYPVLKKHRWLTPVMQVHRWFSRLLSGRSGTLLREIRVVRSATDEQTDAAVDLLSQLGL